MADRPLPDEYNPQTKVDMPPTITVLANGFNPCFYDAYDASGFLLSVDQTHALVDALLLSLRGYDQENVDEYNEGVLQDRQWMKTQKGSKSGFVYLLASMGFYKIGMTNDVWARVAQIQTSTHRPVSLHHCVRSENARELESYWHKRFTAKRQSGEWFALNEAEVREFCYQEDGRG